MHMRESTINTTAQTTLPRARAMMTLTHMLQRSYPPIEYHTGTIQNITRFFVKRVLF